MNNINSQHCEKENGRQKVDTIVLLATYNGERYLAEQLDSLLHQTYQSFVCYIHDDGSQDNTIHIIKDYCERYPNKFISLSFEGKHGAVGNFMSMISYADSNIECSYVLFCDQDDVWLHKKIEKEVCKVKELEKKNDKKPILVYCDQKLVNEKLDVIAESGRTFSHYGSDSEKFLNLAFENCAAGCVMCINRELLQLCNYYKKADNIVMHDWWVMLLASKCGIIEYVDEPLMLYRQHGNNTLGAESRNLKHKVVKYIKNFSNSVSKKSKHVKRCERQICELKDIPIYGLSQDPEIAEFYSACGRSKIGRMTFFFSKGYLTYKEAFTLLFV